MEPISVEKSSFVQQFESMDISVDDSGNQGDASALVAPIVSNIVFENH